MHAMAASPNVSDARALPTPDALAEAFRVEVYDNQGKTTRLGELVKGQRTALIFIRHFWCVNCQLYLRHLSEAAPPSALPANTQVVVIGCGSWQPIDTWVAASSCKYPVYTDPSNTLHAVFKFKSNLSNGDGSEPRDYMRGAGGPVARCINGVKAALGSVQHLTYVGPKSQNGGEVIVSADGECEFMNRMQTTVDHINVSELASLLGVKNHEINEQ